MGRMNIPSPNEEGLAHWLGQLKGFAHSTRNSTQAGVSSSTFYVSTTGDLGLELAAAGGDDAHCCAK